MAEEQHIPIKVYRTHDMIVVAAAMPGLGTDDIRVEVTDAGRLVLDGRLLAEPKLDGTFDGTKEVLVNEWIVGPYHRELPLVAPVDGPRATVTYGNGVLVVALPISDKTRHARLVLEPIGPNRGERAGDRLHPPHR